MKIQSPCINKCKAKDGVCSGCNRTIEEIKHWRGYSNIEKRTIVDRLKKQAEEKVKNNGGV
jgi:hypothetical protein